MEHDTSYGDFVAKYGGNIVNQITRKSWRTQVPWDKSAPFILLGFNNNKILLKYLTYSYSFKKELSNDILKMAIQQLSQIWQVKIFLLHLSYGPTSLAPRL